MSKQVQIQQNKKWTQTNPNSLANLKNAVKFKKGQTPWNKGIPASKKVKDAVSKANKGKRNSPNTEFKKGQLPANWKGGVSGDYRVKNKEKIAGRKRPENCELCGDTGRMCFDHCHKTGKFRGWICIRCNFALGYVRDNEEILLKMIDYLKNNG